MSAVLSPAVMGVLSKDIDLVWGFAEPLIKRACDYSDGKIETSDVYEALKSRDMQLWLVPGGVWVTRIVTYPRSKRVEWIAAAGKWEDWLTHAEIVFDWARSQGCDAAEAGGRAGWGKKTGWDEIHRTFRVRI